MRHKMNGRALGRSSGERQALFRNQLVSLLMHERIRTTQAKARELQPMAEHVLSMAASRQRAEPPERRFDPCEPSDGAQAV